MCYLAPDTSPVANPTLPLDMICEIATKHPSAYYRLVMSCSAVANTFNTEYMKKHFTTLRAGQPGSTHYYERAWRMPNSMLHRGLNDFPTIRKANIHYYYYEDKLHREDGPAVISRRERTSNRKGKDKLEWYRHGKRHREDGPASVDSIEGIEMWFYDGLMHRGDDLPAYSSRLEKKWYICGKLHRETGPAIVRTDGTSEFWINGSRN